MELKYLEQYMKNNEGVVIAKEYGEWTDICGKWNINHSTILTTLIKESARCEMYSSDLFIDWRNVEKELETMKEGEREIYVFGFRNMGVDGNTFVNARLEIGDSAYFAVYVLEMEIIEKYGCLQMEMTLKRYK